MGRYLRISAVVALLVLLSGVGVRGCVHAYERDTATIEVKGRVIRSSDAAASRAHSDARPKCERERSWFSRLLGFSAPKEVVVFYAGVSSQFHLATVNCKTGSVFFGGKA